LACSPPSLLAKAREEPRIPHARSICPALVEVADSSAFGVDALRDGFDLAADQEQLKEKKYRIANKSRAANIRCASNNRGRRRSSSSGRFDGLTCSARPIRFAQLDPWGGARSSGVRQQISVGIGTLLSSALRLDESSMPRMTGAIQAATAHDTANGAWQPFPPPKRSGAARLRVNSRETIPRRPE